VKKVLTSVFAAFAFLFIIGLNDAKAATETESNDTLSQATELKFYNSTGNQYKASITGQLKDEYDDDYYRFSLSKAGNIAFKISESAGTKFEVTLYDADGDSMEYYSTDYENSSNPVTLFYQGLDKGTYYVKVEYYSGSYTDNIPYTLALDYSQSDFFEKEYNNNPSTANPIALNSIYKGYADEYNNEDYYSFRITQKGEVKVDLSPSPNSKFEVTLYNSHGESMETWYTGYNDNTNLSNVIYTGLPAGTYFVKVEVYSGLEDNIPYQLRVSFKANTNFEEEENDSMSNSNLISVNNPIGATLSSDYDKDYYRLNVTKKMNLSMYLTMPSNVRFYVEIFDQNNDTDKYFYTPYGNGTLSKATDITLNPGIYYISIERYNGDVNKVPYNLKFIERDVTPPGKPKVDAVTDKSTTITGSTEANATVYLKDGNKLNKSVKADKNGKFKFSISKINGGKKLYISASDSSGNKSAETVLTVKDTTAPSAPKVDKVTTQTTSVTGKTEGKAKVVIKVGSKVIGQGTADSKGSFKVKISKQKQNVKLSIYAVDSSKNTSKATTIAVKDGTPPSAPKVDKVTTKTTSVTGKTEGKAKVVIKVGSKVIGQGTADTKGKYKVKISKQKKNTKLSIYAVDAANNTSKATTVTVK